MENATKALLIAASVLIAILLISFGIYIYKISNEAVQGMDLSDQEVTQFNDQFTKYEGSRKRGTEINALISDVFQNNLKHEDNVNQQIDLKVDLNDANDGKIQLKKSSSTTTGGSTTGGSTTTGKANPGKVPTGNVYTVTIDYDTKTRLVTSITAVLNK